MTALRRTIGLTLGKYAPLHRGHQLVIETALAAVDDVIVVIYDAPDVTYVPLSVRAGWLRQLYPALTVLEAWDGPTVVGATPEIQQLHEDYMCRLLGTQRITHFYSSEFYGAHMSRALGAENCQVDPARVRMPISATRIRADPYAARAFLEPLVYRDLITNVALLGAPATGKTTLATHLAALYRTVWTAADAHSWPVSTPQLIALAEAQLTREQVLSGEANRYLFIDTQARTTDVQLRQLVDAARMRYDLVLLCDADLPLADEDGHVNDAQRQVCHKQIVAALLAQKIPFLTLRGALHERVATVQRVLARFQKYRSVVDTLI